MGEEPPYVRVIIDDKNSSVSHLLAMEFAPTWCQLLQVHVLSSMTDFFTSWDDHRANGRRYSAFMSESCAHPEMLEGLCSLCGYCRHDVVLNGACMACGREDLAVTIKPEGPSNVVPLSKLVRKPTDTSE